MVAARLERDVDRRAGQIAATGRPDCLDFGVGAAELLVKAFADRLVVDRDDRADEGIGADPPPAALRQFDRAGKQASIGVGLQRHTALEWRI